MNKKLKTVLFISIISLFFACGVAFAAVLFESFVVSQAHVETDTTDKIIDVSNDSATPLQISSSKELISFDNAGDYEELTLTLTNRTNSVIQYQYEFAFDGPTFTLQTESFASCILVYYNDLFIDTLGNLCANEDGRVESGKISFINYVDKATESSSSATTDKIKFEMHSSSDGSIFDNNNKMYFNIRTYANTADYEHNIFVRNTKELERAFNDLNTGLLPSDIKIILFDDITLATNYTLNYPVEIDLNGNELIVNSTLTLAGEGQYTLKSSKKMSITSLSQTGSIVLNSSDAILDIEDFYNGTTNVGYLYSNKTTIIAYDSVALATIVESRVKNNLRYGISSNSSINLFGGLTCYNLEVTTSTYLTYSKPNLTATSSAYNNMESIIIDLDNNLEIGVKIISSTNAAILTSLLNNELKHLSYLSTEVSGTLVNTNAADLFLPTSIKSKGVTITWVSSDETLISDTGVVSSNISGDATVTLYAHININDEVITYAFRIKTMSQNHETLFQYFIAQLSPIEIDQIYTTGLEGSALYFLPIVDSNYNPLDNSSYQGFDYRHEYTTPEDTNTYEWEGFNNVGFEYINYSPISTYNFISIEQNATIGTKSGVAVYLNSATFQTFAQIQVTAKFNGDDEIYTSTANVLIELGYNTELNELVFNKVLEDLNEINVLQNILDTRKEDGMIDEKGDFYLDGSYQTYKISYSIPASSQNVISKIEGYAVDDDGNPTGNPIETITYGQSFNSNNVPNIGKYKICLNIEGFDTSDTNFGVNVILSMPGVSSTTATRILYFECPGIIKNDDTGFANMSVFNSVKYQVYKELCSISSEKGDSDVRDDNYTVTDSASFAISGSVLTNYTGAYILRHDANLCTTLAFSLAETNKTTDNHKVYGLVKLIEWAIGTDSTTTFSTYFNGLLDSSFISSNTSLANYVADGTKNITSPEKNAIKTYYTSQIGVTSDEFETLWSTVSTTQDYYIIYNPSTLTSDVYTYLQDAVRESSNINSKYDEVYQWAHNDKDFQKESDGYEGNPPNYGVIGVYNWGLTKENIEQFAAGTLTLSATSVSGWTSSYYCVNQYKENESENFSKEEMCVYITFLLNANTNTTGANTSTVNKVRNIFLNHFTIPTYFTSTGISDLINQAYSDLGNSFSSSGFTSDISTFNIMGTNYNTPHVTALDFSTIGFDYFPNLKTLLIQGDVDGKLKAFHSEKALETFFNRITSNNTALEDLACEYCSDSSFDFSLKTISGLNNLKRVSFYHNQGITNIGALLKLSLENLTYVDVADINIKFEYYEFVLQAINLKATNPTVYYYPDNTTNHSTYTTKLNTDAEGLIYLEEFYELLAENTNMTDKVYTSSGSQNIQWKIEEGNGITLVNNSYTNSQMYNLGYALNPNLIKYYLVINAFNYGGYNFLANHLYWIYDDGNGNIVFETVKDGDGNDIVVTVGTAPTSLSEAVVNQYITDNEITPTNGTETNNSVEYSAWTNTSNANGSPIERQGRTQRIITIYDYDGTTHSLTTYGFGRNTNKASRTKTSYTETSVLTNYYFFEIIKYYASLSNGYYTITKAVYSIEKFDEESSTTTGTQQTEQVYNFYYFTSRNSGRTSLLQNYPKIAYFTYSGTTYSMTSTTYGYTISNPSSITPVVEQTLNYFNSSRLSNDTYYTAIPLTQTMYQTIENTIARKYIAANVNNFYWYDEGVQQTLNLAYGGHTITLNTRANGGGFTYSATLTENGDEAQSYKAALAMKDILDEANTHLNDAKFGLYYHKYYAFPGAANVSFVLGDFVANFRANGVYFLEIGNDGKFYWAQDANSNAQYYTKVTGTYTNLFALVSTLSSADEGKIYYYIGTASENNTVGTNIFYQVLYNFDSGAYYFRRFGILGSSYLLCNDSGDFNNSWALNTYGTPSGNTNGLYVLCNQMKYMDTNFFVNNSVSKYFTYGIGGRRQAVFTAVITVNGVKYERKFVIDVAS